MLDQLFNIVKQFGQDTVVNNPEVPNENNEEVMADATKTIASGFQNVLAGGGFQNILDLFKGGGNTGRTKSGVGIGGLLKNPMVSMMIGYFISKLVGKYKMSPSSASSVANNLIPNALSGLINQTNDPNNAGTTLDGLIGSLTGGGGHSDTNDGGSKLQDILDNFTGGGGNGGSGGGFNLQDIIGQLTNKAQNSFQGRESSGGGGLMDLIKGFIK
ncbi:MAG: hypothetical protein SGI83_09665 [Bacteroidota bacterium]|nr:hypothetical protein [Bacteroidota bacterium]